MEDAFMGTIVLFAGNYAPRNWMICQGQTLNINQYSALFVILGTTYGGNGTTTFCLPDLRSRIPIGTGQGNGLTNSGLGKMSGAETVTLSYSHLPAHTHAARIQQLQIPVNNTPNGADTTSPVEGVLAVSKTNSYATVPNANYRLPNNSGTVTVDPAGSNQPVSIMQPTLGLNYIMCVNGLYPARE